MDIFMLFPVIHKSDSFEKVDFNINVYGDYKSYEILNFFEILKFFEIFEILKFCENFEILNFKYLFSF